jgi:regulator of sirC expression with transglutaminase-like and TPR domain
MATAPEARTSARDRFRALIEGSEISLNVAEAALLIAQEEYEGVEIGAYLNVLDDLARSAAQRVAQYNDPGEQVDALNHFVFVEQGFHGNRDDYYDPANSYLNHVLDRRTGIPITLSVVYTEIGQRIGLPLFGVGFPGHFLVKYVGADREILVDPFFGTRLSGEQCEERLRTMYGPTARLEPSLLRPASPKEILARILRNLKNVYAQREDWHRTLACLDRVLMIEPEAPADLRDRGLTYYRLECFGPALTDLEHFLELTTEEDQTTASVRALIPSLQRAVSQMN